jgi:hypothetical protein
MNEAGRNRGGCAGDAQILFAANSLIAGLASSIWLAAQDSRRYGGASLPKVRKS